jgi:predicted hotdog family 3-hydroxylacyl-ACP dehydratase
MIAIEHKIIAQGPAVHRLLPQAPPFTMVDSLFFCNNKKAISGLLITIDNPLVASGYFQEPGLLENIAQTVALKAGYEAAVLNQSPQIGFIASVKDFLVHNLVPVGEMLITEIEILMTFENMLVVNGHSHYNNIPVASCELRLFIQQ